MRSGGPSRGSRLEVRRAAVLAAVFTLSAFALLYGLAGCAADHRPKYVMPKLANDQVAVVVGQYNVLSSYEIHEVDGARVTAPPFAMNYPVKVLPGERRLKVVGAAGQTRSEWSFVHNFQAGHRYVISPSAGGPFQAGLKLTDKTTNTSTIID